MSEPEHQCKPDASLYYCPCVRTADDTTADVSNIVDTYTDPAPIGDAASDITDGTYTPTMTSNNTAPCGRPRSMGGTCSAGEWCCEGPTTEYEDRCSSASRRLWSRLRAILTGRRRYRRP